MPYQSSRRAEGCSTASRCEKGVRLVSRNRVNFASLQLAWCETKPSSGGASTAKTASTMVDLTQVFAKLSNNMLKAFVAHSGQRAP
eukprot:2965797-Amphidinium_carterae.1